MPIDALLEILIDLAGEAPEVIGDMAGELGQDIVETIIDLGIDAGDLSILRELVDADLASIASQVGADGIDPDIFAGFDPHALTDAGVDFAAPFESYEQVVVEPDVDSAANEIDAGYPIGGPFLEDPLVFDGYDHGGLAYDPGSADLISTVGFEESGWGDVHSATDELASAVPAGHLAELGPVSYSPEPYFDSESGGYLFGSYNPESGSIEIVNADPEANINAFRHEVGHHYWSRNPDLHDDYMWARIRDAAIGGGPALNTPTSLYAPVDWIEESFCNDYADYLGDPGRFRWYKPEIASILDRVVGSGPVGQPAIA